MLKFTKVNRQIRNIYIYIKFSSESLKGPAGIALPSGCDAYWFLVFGFFAKATGRTVRQIWTNKGSKRVVPRKVVPFGGLNDVPQNFGGKISKNWNFGGVNRTFNL